MSTNTDLFTSSGTESSGSHLMGLELERMNNYVISYLEQPNDSTYDIYFYPLNDQLQEIQQRLNHPIAPDVELFLLQNFSIIPAIKTALQRCNDFLTSFFSTIRSDEKLEHANISNETIQADYDIEIWEDPDFDDTPTPVLIISLPERQGYDIFTLWEKIDRIIYESIDPKLLFTSVREF